MQAYMTYTVLKFNIARENMPSQKERSLPTIFSSGAMLNFIEISVSEIIVCDPEQLIQSHPYKGHFQVFLCCFFSVCVFLPLHELLACVTESKIHAWH